ncbi:MAG: tRNA pseudouridine(38-40) synthase TruA [Bacillota bacterium]|jgi:tRNA pseudouridine38-40 synthase
MRNIKLLIEYDGTNYVGWQRQPVSHGKSIQGLIEDGIKKMVHHEVKLLSAGRTDAGVHALGQVANFYTASTIPAERFPWALKSMLPSDIVVKGAWDVPKDFHARYSALEKTYRYTIRTAGLPSAFEWRYVTHIPGQLNLSEMKKAAGFLVGTHDYRSFCAKGSPVKSFVRTVKKAELTEDKNHIYFEVTADGFLYNMVRIMVGTLVEIGRGYWPAEEVLKILAAKERKYAGPTALPQGLTLWEVKY